MSAAVALTRMASPCRSAPMSSIRRRMVAFTLKAFDPVVNPDNSLPFVSVMLTQLASPT